MQITAKLNNLRISPRKIRIIAKVIRGKSVKDAEIILNFAVKKGTIPLLKLLKSAIANARNNFKIGPENLYIRKLTVDEGPKFKRWMPRARGQAYQIQKKTSHITLILEEGENAAPAAKQEEVQDAQEDRGNKAAQASENKKRAPKPELKKPKPKVEKGFRRIFQRKAI